MSRFLEIICSKCQNLKKLKGKTKDKNLVETHELVVSCQSVIVEQVFNN
jgi:hypothetical protein